MTFAEYMNEVQAHRQENPTWRYGQTLVNILSLVNVKVYHKYAIEVAHGGRYDLDPFYNDKNSNAFLTFVEANWSDNG